jgi:hypothetical protein
MSEFEIKELVDQLLFFLSQNLGVTLPRILAGVLGLGGAFFACIRFWERRWRLLPSLAAWLAGGFLFAIALSPQLLHAVLQMSFLDRIRVMLGGLSLLVFSITFESIRISRLKERYAFLWLGTSFMVLLSALFPWIIDLITGTLGVQYVTAIVVVVFTFLLLVAFHFSIALSGLEQDRASIAQKCALLELRLTSLEKAVFEGRPLLKARPPADPAKPTGSGSALKEELPVNLPRKLSGGKVAAWAVVVTAWLLVVWAGLQTREPMVGDEVTHYYMLTHQAELLPRPVFQSLIPVEFSEQPELRNYPHVNGWHYLGAWVYRILPSRFAVVQLFHSLFFLQLLWFCYRWAVYRRGQQGYSPFLFVLLVATLPMNLFFGTALYQDVPLAAQAVTAFYFLDRRRFALAGLFIALAMWVKVTGVLFLPFFFIVAAAKALEEPDAPQRIPGQLLLLGKRLALPLLLCTLTFAGNSISLSRFGNADYLPEARLRQAAGRIFSTGRDDQKSAGPAESSAKTAVMETIGPPDYEIVANHPGDLRNPMNAVIYGGGALWLVVLTGFSGLIRPRGPTIMKGGSRRHAWPMLVGAGYMACVAILTSTAPDVRFFLPGIPFLILPLSEWTMRMPRIKAVLLIITVVGVLQSGYVVRKFLNMRAVSEELKEGIRFLRESPPEPERVFMYPEGNYRLFSVEHDWYLDYAIQDFWTMTETEQLAVFRRRNIGGVVVKKHLIGPVRNPRRDLGSYPPEFVDSLRNSSSYQLVFENDELIVFYLNSAPLPAAD